MTNIDERSIQNFLRKFNHKLEPNEKVLHYSENKISSSNDGLIIASLYLICGLAAVFSLTVVKSFTVALVFLVSIGIISEVAEILKKQPKAQSIENQPFCLITTEGIRLKYRPIIPWKDLYDIDFRYLNGQNILMFHLSHRKENITLTNLVILKSRFFSNTIMLGTDNDAEAIYKELFPYWSPNAPKTKLKQVGAQLSERYGLSEETATNSQFRFAGHHNNLPVKIAYDRSFPFKKAKSVVKLQKPIPFHLSISKETVRSVVEQHVGIKDIQIGHTDLDKNYHFQSSHPDLLQQLFSPEVIDLFERIAALGTVAWSFGAPFQLKKLNTNSSTVFDSEDILDTNLLNIEDQPTHNIEDNAHDTLEFQGILNPSFESYPDKAVEFVELGTELSILISEKVEAILE